MKLYKLALLYNLLSSTQGVQKKQTIVQDGFTFEIDIGGMEAPQEIEQNEGDLIEEKNGPASMQEETTEASAYEAEEEKIEPVVAPVEVPVVVAPATQKVEEKVAEPVAAPVQKVEEKPKIETTLESIKNEIESKVQAAVHASPNADGLRWDHTAKELKELQVSLVKKWNTTANEIIAFKGARNFENTIKVIANFESDLEFESQSIAFYSSVHVSKEMRDASKAFDKAISDYNTELWMRHDLYNCFIQYKKNAEKDGSYKKLDAESKKYVEKTLYDFQRNGLGLSDSDKKKLMTLTKQIGDLEQKAETNIAEDKEFVNLAVKDLDGVPPDMIKQLVEKRSVPGTNYTMVKVSLDKNKAGAFMGAFTNENTRKLMKEAMDNVNRDNLPIMDELMTKRHQSALLLNYTNFSERTLEDKMAKNIDNVEKLLNDLTLRISEQGSSEMDKLVQFKRKQTGNKTAVFEAWDFQFYASKYDTEVLDLDESSMSDFFPSERVVQLTQQIYQDLLGLTFAQIKKPSSVWHKDVTMYEVHDKVSKKLLGHFYLDLYPRPDKFNHAAVFTLTKRHRVSDQKTKLASAAMVTNLSPPSKTEPSLLSHQDVITFFHEFGHVMHNMCNEANYTKFSGAQVEQDFVEMPSQMLENWIWQPKVLKMISKHYKTGKQLDDATIQKKIASKNLHSATETLNQITMATVDLILNSAYTKQQTVNSQQALMSYFTKGDAVGNFRKNLKYKDDRTLDTGDLWQRVEEKIENIHDIPGVNPVGHLGHLLSGYVSTYYSYLWSEVYSADLFSVFQKEGIFNKELGMRYRKTILAPGGSVDSIDSVRTFLGREPNDKAFLINNGFVKKTEAKKVEVKKPEVKK